MVQGFSILFSSETDPDLNGISSVKIESLRKVLFLNFD
ncbi:hypothetical protein MUS_2454 [Bacillus velezensis YAU B9601-Y2]|uniref:Uncharacterized protein n=1 Tax=Bacillus amyloliquefaciens (strain Y2) TaxID=1155777 RepID=I2C6W0_BACAY|nr:hypothetical protein MUS_2454 [Bacillus velezensis YAU B9601-Y2]